VLESLESGPTALRRLLWLAAGGLAFFAVYGACTAITARRSGVGTWYHPLELEIPFVPWMIVPYWTSDLLFVGAFLLAPDRPRLDALGKRVLAAIAVAGLGFLLVPLRLAFPRPEVAGVPGALFAVLRSFDGPHNLFPSLHVRSASCGPTSTCCARAGSPAGSAARRPAAGSRSWSPRRCSRGSTTWSTCSAARSSGSCACTRSGP
jgi:hypothetical protein